MTIRSTKVVFGRKRNSTTAQFQKSRFSVMHQLRRFISSYVIELGAYVKANPTHHDGIRLSDMNPYEATTTLNHVEFVERQSVGFVCEPGCSASPRSLSVLIH